MSILTFPNITPNANNWGIQANSQTMQSELDGSVQTAALPGDKWADVLTFTNLFDVAKTRALIAFLASLRGESGRFYLSPPGYKRAGSGAGSPLVKGAAQTGLSIITDGWTASQTGVLLVGDYFQIGNELKMVTAGANSDPGGNATLYFTPPIRISPADNAAVVITKPTCIMKLKDNSQARWPSQPGRIYAMSIAVEEAIS